MARIKDRLKALITALGGTPVGETDGPLLTELEDAVENGSGGGGDSTPSGSVTITKNGDTDVTSYATATVNVTACVVSFDLNGGTGTVAPIAVANGSVAELPGSTGITLPEGKQYLIGWALTSDSDSVLANDKPTADATVYAIYGPRDV